MEKVVKEEEKGAMPVTEARLNEELAKFGKEVMQRLKGMEEEVDALRSEMGKLGVATPTFLRCTAKGCDFKTDDLAKFVDHRIDEKLSSPFSETPEETETEKPRPRRHKTWDEFLDCEICAPKIEKILLEKGWKKPEPKKKSLLL